MPQHTNVHGRKSGRGVRPWLIMCKLVGLMVFIGGLAAISAMWFFGPTPASDDPEGWVLLRGLMRGIFYPCVLCGMLVVILAGVGLWLQHPREFSRMRWLRVKVILLAILLPGLHFWSRSQVLLLYSVIDSGRCEQASVLWDRVGPAFFVAVITMLLVASIGRVKPRLRQPYAPAKERLNLKAH